MCVSAAAASSQGSAYCPQEGATTHITHPSTQMHLHVVTSSLTQPAQLSSAHRILFWGVTLSVLASHPR